MLTPAPPQEKLPQPIISANGFEKELRSIFSRLCPAMSDKEITNLIYNQGLTIIPPCPWRLRLRQRR